MTTPAPVTVPKLQALRARHRELRTRLSEELTNLGGQDGLFADDNVVLDEIATRRARLKAANRLFTDAHNNWNVSRDAMRIQKDKIARDHYNETVRLLNEIEAAITDTSISESPTFSPEESAPVPFEAPVVKDDTDETLKELKQLLTAHTNSCNQQLGEIGTDLNRVKDGALSTEYAQVLEGFTPAQIRATLDNTSPRLTTDQQDLLEALLILLPDSDSASIKGLAAAIKAGKIQVRIGEWFNHKRRSPKNVLDEPTPVPTHS